MIDSDLRAKYTPLFVEMLPLYPSLLAEGRHLGSRYRRVGHLAHGWYLRCHRGVEAVVLLDEGGHAEEAAPIRRSIIEHGLALKWLAAEGDDILDTVARGHARDAEQRADAVTEADWTSVDVTEIARIIAEVDSDQRNASQDHLLHFAHRLAKYGDAHTRPGYLAECAKSHPSYSSAMSYIGVPSGAYLLNPRDPIGQTPFATSQLLDALLAVRQVFDPPPWEEVLEAILKQFLDVTDEVRAQTGLPPVDWETGELRTAAPDAG